VRKGFLRYQAPDVLARLALVFETKMDHSTKDATQTDAEPDAEPTPDEKRALERTRWPGNLLILIGLLNTTFGLFYFYEGVHILRMPLGDFERLVKSDSQLTSALGVFKQIGGKEEQFQFLCALIRLLWSAVALPAGTLTMYGGVNLRDLNYFRLTMVGSVTALVPFLSPVACFGVGEAVGAWCLIVALRKDVRPMFRGP
jgi:hypothetical protein